MIRDWIIQFTTTQVKGILENVISETMEEKQDMFEYSFDKKNKYITYVAINGKLYDLSYIEEEIREQGIK